MNKFICGIILILICGYSIYIFVDNYNFNSNGLKHCQDLNKIHSENYTINKLDCSGYSISYSFLVIAITSGIISFVLIIIYFEDKKKVKSKR